MDLLSSAQLIYKQFSSKEKRQLTILFISTTFNGLVQTLGIVSVMPLIALLTEPSLAETHKYFLIIKDILPVEFHQSLLLVLGLFSFAVLLLGNLFVIFDYWLTLRFFNITEFKLSIRLFRQYMNFDYLNFKKKRLSDMSRNVIHEVDRVIVGALLAMVGLVSDFIIAISIISLLLYVNFWVTVVASLLIGLMYSLIYLFVIKKIEHLGNEFSKQESRVFSAVKQNLELFREIRVARKFKYFMKKYTVPAKRITRSATRYNILKMVPEQIIEIFAFGLVIFIAIYFSSKSETSALVISSVAFFAFAVYRLIPIVKDIFDGIEELKYLNTSLQNVVSEYDFHYSRSQSLEQQPSEQQERDLLESIEIRDLSYRYPKASSFVFRKINQKIKVSSFTCVVGSSGVGKSTLFDLLVGLLEPLNGDILINGVALSSYNMDGWLNELGYVPQNIQFFEASIAENIAFGFDRADINLDRVREVAKIAEIDDFINAELAEQYQTVIGDGGLTLSGGQKQRVGLARCLYHSPQIILLDEATNELDLETEKKILDNLLTIPKLTIVFITHKPSVYERADELFDLNRRGEGSDE